MTEMQRLHDYVRQLHEELTLQRGIVMGVRDAVMSKLNRIEKLLVEHHGNNAPPLNLSPINTKSGTTEE